MAPSTQQLIHQLRQIIWYHLDNNLLDNALFLAGRLYAVDSRNPDSIHILSLCHLRAGQAKSAYDYSRNYVHKRDHLGCAYIFGQACLNLHKFSEGTTVLERLKPYWESVPPSSAKADYQRWPLPDVAAFHCLLGKLAHGSGDIEKAIKSYAAALRLNPFMWDAFERLCDTGASVLPTNVFKESRVPASFLQCFDITSTCNSENFGNVQNGQATQDSNPPVQISITKPSSQNDPYVPVSEAGVGAKQTTARVESMPLEHVPNSSANLIETPPALAKDEHGVVPNVLRGTQTTQLEPPNAPLRKPRTQAFELKNDTELAKRRSVRSKTRTKEGSADSIESEQPKASLLPPRTTKRTISGNEPNSKLSQTADTAALGQRRSDRLFKKAPPNSSLPGPKDGEPDLKKVKATGTRGRTAAASTVGRVVSGNRKPVEHHSQDHAKFSQQAPAQQQVHYTNQSNGPVQKQPPPPLPEAPIPQRPRSFNAQPSAIPALMHILQPLAQAYHCLSTHIPQQTIKELQSLPSNQRETPYVLSLLGRAHHDLNAYAPASDAFSRLHALEPSATKHMEVYSTTLWHLKRDTDLAYLAHSLIESQRLAPESWCALGNAFSLQREHEQAIKCFRRATQLAPTGAYAWTLLGHEYVAAEDLEKALGAYRRAVGGDRRCYQGWYGLGRVYERSGRLELAEKHYRIALAIHPTNSVLLCCIGGVQDRLGQHAAALETYGEACRLAPGSAMARFKRARGLLRLRRYEESAGEFEALRDLAPEEANVHFMLGRVYRCMGRRAEAVRCLSGALGLDPKAAPLIKDAMEALGEEDDMGDSDGDEEMVG